MGTGAVFMSHPTAVLKQFLAQNGRNTSYGEDFNWGRLSMALEILTQMKVLDSLPLTDLTVQLGSAFQALLVDAGMLDEAEKWYERLDAWRAPRFVSADKPTDRAFGASSVAAAPEGALARTRQLRQLLPEHHDPDGDTTSDATDESEEGPSESGQATPTE